MKRVKQKLCLLLGTFILVNGLPILSVNAREVSTPSYATETEDDTDSQTAIINGQEVILEQPIKAGKEEADTTQAPKEDLIENNIKRNLNDTQFIAMYRLYNPNNQEHFYTASEQERDYLRQIGWGQYEGIGWYAPAFGQEVYRLYNPILKDHHYTQDQNEVNILTSQHSWVYEGLAWYSDTAQTMPVHRLFNPKLSSGSHHYTPDENEVAILKTRGWNYEGISWYASAQGQQSNEDVLLLGVNNYNQYALGTPSGCEGASLLQALQYKGQLTDWSLRQFLNTIPISPNNNPNTGFVGSPFVENPWTYSAIYPAPLTTWGQAYGNVENISGSSVDTLLNELQNGNPVVVWTTINFKPVRWGKWPFGMAVNNNHAVTLDGYNKVGNQLHVSDPISGSYWLNKTTFETIYNARQYAVVVR